MLIKPRFSSGLEKGEVVASVFIGKSTCRGAGPMEATEDGEVISSCAQIRTFTRWQISPIARSINPHQVALEKGETAMAITGKIYSLAFPSELKSSMRKPESF